MNITTDVLIIGGAGAGCRAAIEAADCGASVLMVTKNPPEKAGATTFPIAEMAGYNAGDVRIPLDVQKHYEDIISAGQGMADPDLAAILATKAPESIETLEKWGVKFEHVGDGYYMFKSCFSNHPRTHVIKGHGEPIVKAMVGQIQKRSNITVLDGVTVMGVVVIDGRCVGAYGLKNEEALYINAKSVILATGGCGQAFERNLNPGDVTGDGYAIAYEAGANLVNMEFMQIGIGFSWPVVNIFNGYIWEGRPKLSDKDGKDILKGVLPEGLTGDDVMHEHRKHFPFSTSDCSKYLEIAIHKAIKEGRGTEHRGIRIDMSNMTDEYINSLEDDCGIHHMWPIAKEYMQSKGVDLLHNEIEISCFAHAINGGVQIQADSSSTIPGLFAAGECAGGPHGADRLGGNMMVTCQVFGEIAGRSAAQYAMKAAQYESIEKIDDPQMKDNFRLIHRNIDYPSMLARLKEATQDYLLVNRTEKGLKKLCELVSEIKSEIESAPLTESVHVRNFCLKSMLTTVEIITKSALERKESRGSHHRADYPNKDERFNHPILVWRKSN